MNDSSAFGQLHRRKEACLHFDMASEARVSSVLGEPTETRHLFATNAAAAISHLWSIQAGAGIGAYRFNWAMAAGNVNFTDMEVALARALV